MSEVSKTTSKTIKYLGRDFDSIKKGLIEFAKVYYPNTYNDFNEASPGMMFIEMSAYVGDVLNYYVDAQFKESLLLHATERTNLIKLAGALGYKPKISVPSITELDLFQLVPASGSGVSIAPDLRYTIKIQPGLRTRNTNGVEFLTQQIVDFGIDNYFDPREISVYSTDNSGNPTYYLLKKTAKAISATVQTKDFVVAGTTKFLKLQLTEDNLIGIDSIVDSEGNTWYEVDYLAQDTIFERVENVSYNDPDATAYSAETPYLLKLKRVPRRFVTRTTDDGIEIQFGSGVSSAPDEELLATPENIALALPTGKDDIDASIDPQAPVFTKAYGQVPANTTLTVTYLVGGGVSSNVPSNTITEIIGIETTNAFPIGTPTLNTTIINSLAVNNAIGATGGRSQETNEEIRQNTLAIFSSQKRAVTREDYTIRAYAMPNIYGSVAKVFITPDEQNNISTSDIYDTVANPLAMNMYLLSYDSDKKLTTANTAIKENLKVYLSQYKMLTDSINLRDGFIINIGVDFDIIPLPTFNANEVLLNCVAKLKQFFEIDNWQMNQPIVISDIYNQLLTVKGVQTITKVNLKNLNDSSTGYSNIYYDLAAATRNGIVYPSLDPSIFEVKYPDNDIRGRIVTF